MIDNLLAYLKEIVKSKLFPMVVVSILLCSILIGRMFFLQILKGEEYDKEGTTRTEKSREIKSARGKIFDCNGKLLASNVQSYAVTMEDTGEISTAAEKNDMIMKCIRLIEKNGDKLALEFPIYLDKRGKAKFSVSKNSQLRFKRDIYYCQAGDELTDEQKSASAQQIFDYLKGNEKPAEFDVVTSDPKSGREKYSDADALKIMTVRYALLQNTYKKYEAVTLSNNVSDRTVAAIKESSADLPGIEITEELKREYYDSEYFAHIIGYTGLISSETLAKYKDEDENTPYTSTDQIGKTGIEKQFESTLRGTKGSETLVIDGAFRVTDIKNIKNPTSGNDIYLTIDSDLQKAYYKILEKKLAGILLSKLNNSTDAGTKGKSAANIRVPIYDVYNAIIENNIISIDHLNDDSSSSLSKSIYQKFLTKKNSTNRRLRNELTFSNTRHGKQLSTTMQDYLDYIFKLLTNKGVILSDSIDKSDATYTNYLKEKISMSKFLQYAISKNWISLDALNIGNDYYSTEEIYQKLIDYILDELSDDTEYFKGIYHELIYDFSLSGREVCLLLYDQGILSKKDKDYTSLKNGSMDAYTFIRKKIRTLKITPGQLGLEPCSGSVVVTDVNTGKVKAMVSYPSYDNNRFANSVDNDYFTVINSSTASPLINRATQQNTAPGSTYKMLAAVTSLQEGIIDPYSTVHDNHEFTKIHRPYPKCWSSTSHGTINVTQALQHSCNYFFYEMGYRLGNGKKDIVNNERGLSLLAKYAKKFGFDTTSGVEVPESQPNMSDTDCVRSAIGQGTNSYTPIQLSRYVTTIANQGTCYNLTILDKINYVSQNKVKQNSAKVREKLSFPDSTWNAISQGMKNVVKYGSIKTLFQNSSVTVAGKTGTAQENDRKPNHALFVSYAPFNNPEISVTAVIANGYTSSNAAELASDIYKYYYKKSSRKKLLKQNVTYPKLDTRAFSD